MYAPQLKGHSSLPRRKSESSTFESDILVSHILRTLLSSKKDVQHSCWIIRYIPRSSTFLGTKRHPKRNYGALRLKYDDTCKLKAICQSISKLQKYLLSWAVFVSTWKIISFIFCCRSFSPYLLHSLRVPLCIWRISSYDLRCILPPFIYIWFLSSVFVVLIPASHVAYSTGFSFYKTAEDLPVSQNRSSAL